MPGMHFAIQKGTNAYDLRRRWDSVTSSMLYSNDYQAKILMAQNNYLFGMTGYTHYPVMSFKTQGASVFFEGYCYNRSPAELKKHLERIVSILHEGSEKIGQVIEGFHDEGDYLCVIILEKEQRLVVFNDRLGRLPTYFCAQENEFLLSREVKFITGFAEEFSFDRQGMAECLLFGYTVDEGSLIKNVKKLRGGVILDVNFNDLAWSYTKIFHLNFDEILSGPREPLSQASDKLAQLFLDGCRYIKDAFEGRPMVLSLSGGLDSRSVLAGMKKVGANILGFTFSDEGMISRGADAIYAQQLAKHFNVPWNLLKRPGMAIQDIEDLLWMKDGLNFSQMAFLLPLFKQIRNTYGPNMVHLTGDNGDKSLKPQGPPGRLKNFDELFDVILRIHLRFKVEDVARLLGLNSKDILNALRSKLATYPEKKLDNQYRHFIFSERLSSWIFQGEDRNRLFHWHVAPFIMFPYWHSALQIPDEDKKNWKLAEAFMARLDPVCNEIPYAAWGAPITSFHRYKTPFLRSIFDQLPVELRIFIRDKIYFAGIPIGDDMGEYFKQHAAQLKAGSAFQDAQSLTAFALGSNVNEFHYLLSMLAYTNIMMNKHAGAGVA